MSYFFKCECGRKIEVETTQSGLMIRCACSRDVRVPRMSALREAAGETPYAQTMLDQIEGMIQEGKLPQENARNMCPVSDRGTDAVAFVNIQCERNITPMDTSGLKVAALLFLGHTITSLLTLARDRVNEGEQRYRGITVPVRISSTAEKKFARLRSSQLKEILCETPIYAQLLAEYPDAMLTFVKCKCDPIS